jgi:hypothetical protein
MTWRLYKGSLILSPLFYLSIHLYSVELHTIDQNDRYRLQECRWKIRTYRKMTIVRSTDHIVSHWHPNAAVNFLTCAWCTVRTHEPCTYLFRVCCYIDNQLESTMSVVWIVFKLTGLNILLWELYFPDLQTSGKKIRVYYVGIAPGQRSFSNDTSPPSRRYRQESILLRWPSRNPSR